MTRRASKRALRLQRSAGGYVPTRDFEGTQPFRCAGLRVDIGDRVTIPSLRPPGTKLLVSGDSVAGVAELWSFDYDDTDLGADGRVNAEADARKFSPDGAPRDSSQTISYPGTPHLYRNERLIVIYAGDDRMMLDLLARLLGRQFAGG